jgi:RNA-directed DNA polymerase
MGLTVGIPTVGDRIAQMVVKRRLEPKLEPVFHPDSYGFRPRKSAHDALKATRKRCWRYAHVVEFDIVKLFDNIDHRLLLRALAHHGIDQSIMLYVERWLKAPLQGSDGTIEPRTKGVPQGGVISPLLSNLFLHYVFDAWMVRRFSEMPFCRYADDAVAHCHTLKQAKDFISSLSVRLRECGLEIHPDKTHIVHCSQNKIRSSASSLQFSFLGYTFRPRQSKNPKTGEYFIAIAPAISLDAEKSVREKMRTFPFVSKRYLSLQDIAEHSRPYLQGWLNYYGVFFRSRLARIASYFNALLVKWAMVKIKNFRGRRGKAQSWLTSVARRRPSLFPHWNLGWTRMVG